MIDGRLLDGNYGRRDWHQKLENRNSPWQMQDAKKMMCMRVQIRRNGFAIMKQGSELDKSRTEEGK
jgi:hypothetical protein